MLWPFDFGAGLALLLLAVSRIVRSSACPFPTEVGANCSVIVQDCPGPRLAEEKGKTVAPLQTTFETENALLAPLKAMLLIVNAAPPVLDSTSCCVLAVLTFVTKSIGPMLE